MKTEIIRVHLTDDCKDLVFITPSESDFIHTIETHDTKRKNFKSFLYSKTIRKI